jgi:RNA polymerase sigma-32 factor
MTSKEKFSNDEGNQINSVPALKTNSDLAKSADSGFARYLKEIQKFPLLTPEEEYEYGMRYKNHGDPEAAKILLQSHLRLVVKMAGKFKQYGLPTVDLVAEGNVGLIQAVKKFDPEKGFRFSTYAMWWIRANIQEYVLRSWSLVKIGTTVAQKKLFFNLHKIRKRIKGASISGVLDPEHITRIAKDLNVSEKDVVDMNSRLQQSDSSLNAMIGDDEDGDEVVNSIAAVQDSQEEIAIENQEKYRQEMMLKQALSTLNEREKDIIIKRQMLENPLTLEELSQIYNISRERIRQIEANAIDKIRKSVSKMQKELS